jgi:[amino group carrier protein]-lysine/ornithine hydrolase
MDEASLLESLVRQYSPSGAEDAAVRAFCRHARSLGFRVRIDGAGNGRAVRGRGRPRTVFLGHIDTVPGRIHEGVRAGRVHGRGSVDAKGALAAALLAGRDFAGPGSLEVIACVGEETDSRGARHLLRLRGIDAVVAGEPNRWDGVGVGYKGCLRFQATFRGPALHLSSPRPTSADRAIDWVARLRAATAAPAETSPFRSLSLKVAGMRTDVGAWDTTAVTVDIRLPPGTNASAVLSRLPRAGREPEIRLIARIEPWEADPRSRAVAALVAGIRAEGARPTLWRKTGTSDLNLVAEAWGCPSAVYGPGDPHLDHTARESLSVRELKRSVRVLGRAFAQLAARG